MRVVLAALVLVASVPALAQDGGAPMAPPDPLADAKATFTRRLDRPALDEAIKLLEAAQGFDARVLGARAHRFRAEAFELRKRPLAKKEGLADLEAARDRALEAWHLREPVQKGGGARDAEQRAALNAAKEDVAPALIELAEAHLALAGWRKPMDAVPELRDALAIATRAVELAPDDPAPRIVRAAALAALPPLAGGDLEESRFEFERAIAAAPDQLAARVEMAARYAVKAQDRKLFGALLLAALKLDPEATPGLVPEQRLARARALGLMHRERELFRG